MKLNQKGFTLVEGLLILVIIGILAGVGWYVWGSNKKANEAYDKSGTASPVTAKNIPGPYDGWKTFCDPNVQGCFKYPQGWHVDHGPSITTQISSPDAELINYSDEPGKYAVGQFDVQMKLAESNSAYGTYSFSNFYTKTIDDIPNNPQLKIVGGYDTAVKWGSYYIVDTTFIKKYNLVVGKVSKKVPNQEFVNDADPVAYAFYAYDNRSEETGTTKSASEWFSTKYAKEALLILKSFRFQ